MSRIRGSHGASGSGPVCGHLRERLAPHDCCVGDGHERTGELGFQVVALDHEVKAVVGGLS